MEDRNLQRLNSLLDQRMSKIEGVRNFYEYFEKFAYLYLKDVVRTIDNELEVKTNESLRFFSENPYEKVSSPFFVMVQLFTNNYRRNSFLLDQSENFPLIKFEGNEFSGNVKATIVFGDKVNKSKEYSISDLNNRDKVFEIMINFLDVIYNI